MTQTLSATGQLAVARVKGNMMLLDNNHSMLTSEEGEVRRGGSSDGGGGGGGERQDVEEESGGERSIFCEESEIFGGGAGNFSGGVGNVGDVSGKGGEGGVGGVDTLSTIPGGGTGWVHSGGEEHGGEIKTNTRVEEPTDRLGTDEQLHHHHNDRVVTTLWTAQLRAVFDTIDRNQDGSINVRELLLALRKHPDVAEFMHLPMHVQQEGGTRETFEEMFQAIDKDGSRDLTWAEFESYFLKINHAAPEEKRNDEKIVFDAGGGGGDGGGTDGIGNGDHGCNRAPSSSSSEMDRVTATGRGVMVVGNHALHGALNPGAASPLGSSLATMVDAGAKDKNEHDLLASLDCDALVEMVEEAEKAVNYAAITGILTHAASFLGEDGEEVAEGALNAVMRLASSGPAVAALGEAGACEAVAIAAKVFMEEPSVMEVALGCFRKLAADNTGNQARLGAASAPALLVTAMAAHMEGKSTLLQEMGCLAVVAMCPGNAAALKEAGVEVSLEAAKPLIENDRSKSYPDQAMAALASAVGRDRGRGRDRDRDMEKVASTTMVVRHSTSSASAAAPRVVGRETGSVHSSQLSERISRDLQHLNLGNTFRSMKNFAHRRAAARRQTRLHLRAILLEWKSQATLAIDVREFERRHALARGLLGLSKGRMRRQASRLKLAQAVVLWRQHESCVAAEVVRRWKLLPFAIKEDQDRAYRADVHLYDRARAVAIRRWASFVGPARERRQRREEGSQHHRRWTMVNGLHWWRTYTADIMRGRALRQQARNQARARALRRWFHWAECRVKLRGIARRVVYRCARNTCTKVVRGWALLSEAEQRRKMHIAPGLHFSHWCAWTTRRVRGESIVRALCHQRQIHMLHSSLDQWFGWHISSRRDRVAFEKAAEFDRRWSLQPAFRGLAVEADHGRRDRLRAVEKWYTTTMRKAWEHICLYVYIVRAWKRRREASVQRMALQGWSGVSNEGRERCRALRRAGERVASERRYVFSGEIWEERGREE